MASMLRRANLFPISGVGALSAEKLKSPPILFVKQRFAVGPVRLKPCRFPAKPFCSPTAASGEIAKTEEAEDAGVQEESVEEYAVDNGSIDDSAPATEEILPSAITAALQSYKEALANDNQSKISEVEGFLQSIEDENNSLANKVAALSEELLVEKDRILRISADFDNFRKRAEREGLSLVENVRGEVLERLLPVLDNFERAKAQIKAETEGEEKINNSYQSIYKQFMEILTSLGVEAIETVGNAFDPMLHEAIMREDSVEFEEGVVILEFRKGFKLGERLLRPSTVKVSAGPGPEKAAEDAGTRADEEREEIDQESNEDGGGDKCEVGTSDYQIL
ncbi:hypothetical protein AXF42_Ash005816 [Apostasia shenzhenica]|uniref:GrpE protein homolog n=1 Tax=Apostasia shenzhenica TaxID=1088818 RepID=A0A2I0BCG7_9ASPA|nr:hypothetical protein AXF42_Ash005816 [Apostasia shenzhenica]